MGFETGCAPSRRLMLRGLGAPRPIRPSLVTAQAGAAAATENQDTDKLLEWADQQGLSRAGLRPASFQGMLKAGHSQVELLDQVSEAHGCVVSGLRGMAACKALQPDDELTSVPLDLALVQAPRQGCPFPKVNKDFWSKSPW